MFALPCPALLPVDFWFYRTYCFGWLFFLKRMPILPGISLPLLWPQPTSESRLRYTPMKFYSPISCRPGMNMAKELESVPACYSKAKKETPLSYWFYIPFFLPWTEDNAHSWPWYPHVKWVEKEKVVPSYSLAGILLRNQGEFATLGKCTFSSNREKFVTFRKFILFAIPGEKKTTFRKFVTLQSRGKCDLQKNA